VKIPFSWLKEHTPIKVSVDEVVAALIRLGHEVEGVDTPRRDVQGVRVGLIVDKAPHPNADRLSVLKVDLGEAEPLAIVCGASNMDVGDKVPVATVGTRLPNGLTIKKGKIRGEVSFGMCCSEAELGLAEDAEGLLILPEEAPVGMEVGEWLGLEEAVFDLSITPNRGDCMSAHGLARELAADMTLPMAQVKAIQLEDDASVASPRAEIIADEDCPYYLSRRIEGVHITASPAWMQQGLLLAGMRPVNGIVDVLNYTMLYLGQPMHAFDADKLQGDLQLRRAETGESFTALDGRKLQLTHEDLVVADAAHAVAMAGIMGSEASGVDENSVNIVLESAYFRPATISRSRRHHGMVSEASMRFERGVDPAMVEVAMQQASKIIVDLFGGKVGPVEQAGSIQKINARRVVRCRIPDLESRLGIAIPENVDQTLERMGFSIRRQGDRLDVGVPAFRHDVTIAEDMAEEYARIIGFDRIPERMPPLSVGSMETADDSIRLAVANGAVQVITYSFIAEEEQRHFVAEDGHDLVLSNPISEAMRTMRRSLWPGLLNVARYNMNRQQAGVSLVEQGRIYEALGEVRREHNMLAWLMAGELEVDQWYAKARAVDFFDLKGAVDAWLAKRRLTARWIADDGLTGLQPGQAARIMVGKHQVGMIGRVMRNVAAFYELEVPVYVATLDLDVLPEGRSPRYAPTPEFPGVQRDLVFLFDKRVIAEKVIRCVQQAAGKLLAEARVFDIYQGQGVPEGKISMGIRFTLQDTARTLTQTDTDAVSEAVVTAIEKQFGAVLR